MGYQGHIDSPTYFFWAQLPSKKKNARCLGQSFHSLKEFHLKLLLETKGRWLPLHCGFESLGIVGSLPLWFVLFSLFSFGFCFLVACFPVQSLVLLSFFLMKVPIQIYTNTHTHTPSKKHSKENR